MCVVAISVDFTQVNHLAVTLERSGAAVGALASAAIRKTAHDIEADAKALCPVDTGFLKGSISTTISGDGRFGEMTAEIGPTAEYGIYQELGTSVMAAQPYLGPAFDRRAPLLERALGEAGVKAIEL